ncbi:Uncharacterized protein TCM_045199 [Theobroma cacao]|uniref:Uncharacterized protein n=1 Tax=Theobroma cacao TaxID=3641 RepID=A0A061FR94_THECC|nr:Uncharacterized protein TCM_045199 [Theobroma cacao]
MSQKPKILSSSQPEQLKLMDGEGGPPPATTGSLFDLPPTLLFLSKFATTLLHRRPPSSSAIVITKFSVVGHKRQKCWSANPVMLRPDLAVGAPYLAMPLARSALQRTDLAVAKAKLALRRRRWLLL